MCGVMIQKGVCKIYKKYKYLISQKTPEKVFQSMS